MSDIPTSGAISLNQMHTEVGGASGSIVSINDADIRALISKGSGATMSFNEWYGASSSLDSQSLTVGTYSPYYYYTGTYYGAGRNLPANTWRYGSMSDGTSDWAGQYLYHAVYSATTSPAGGSGSRPTFRVAVRGINNANSGWNTVTANGQTFSRTSMAFVNTGQGYSQWIYTYPSYSSTNVFDSNDVGSTFTVVFN
jgi:hypothetical protein